VIIARDDQKDDRTRSSDLQSLQETAWVSSSEIKSVHIVFMNIFVLKHLVTMVYHKYLVVHETIVILHEFFGWYRNSAVITSSALEEVT